MEKIKKFVKKNQILLIAVCVCIAALTVAFFAGGNLSENKVQTASTASSLSTTNADTETTSVSAQRKPLKILPIPLNQTKIKRTKKIPKIKRTVRIIRRTVTVQLLKKVRNPSRVQATVLRIRKNRLLHQTVLQSRTKRMIFSRQRRTSTKPIPYRRENQSRLNRKNRKQKIQIFIVPLQSPVQQFLTTWMTLIPKKLNSFQRTV